jgi:hypothetical protein
MKRRFDSYRRLARGVFGVSSLWLGPKDLLYVRGTGVLLPFSEEYLRFELDRIQSAAVVRTRTGLVLNVVYGGLALVLGGLGGVAIWQARAVGGELAGFYVFLAVPLFVLAAVALALFLVNLALGPTCHFQVQTATRLERLRAVRRVRPARRVLAQLIPALLAAQEAGGAERGVGGSGGSVGSVGSVG